LKQKKTVGVVINSGPAKPLFKPINPRKRRSIVARPTEKGHRKTTVTTVVPESLLLKPKFAERKTTRHSAVPCHQVTKSKSASRQPSSKISASGKQSTPFNGTTVAGVSKAVASISKPSSRVISSTRPKVKTGLIRPSSSATTSLKIRPESDSLSSSASSRHKPSSGLCRSNSTAASRSKAVTGLSRSNSATTERSKAITELRGSTSATMRRLGVYSRGVNSSTVVKKVEAAEKTARAVTVVRKPGHGGC